MIMSSIVDIRQINMKKLIRDVEKKEATRLLKQIIENNMVLLNLQRQILELQIVEDEKRKKQQEREQGRRENEKK